MQIADEFLVQRFIDGVFAFTSFPLCWRCRPTSNHRSIGQYDRNDDRNGKAQSDRSVLALQTQAWQLCNVNADFFQFDCHPAHNGNHPQASDDEPEEKDRRSTDQDKNGFIKREFSIFHVIRERRISATAGMNITRSLMKFLLFPRFAPFSAKMKKNRAFPASDERLYRASKQLSAKSLAISSECCWPNQGTRDKLQKSMGNQGVQTLSALWDMPTHYENQGRLRR
jgi:hypothetical protein